MVHQYTSVLYIMATTLHNHYNVLVIRGQLCQELLDTFMSKEHALDALTERINRIAYGMISVFRHRPFGQVDYSELRKSVRTATLDAVNNSIEADAFDVSFVVHNGVFSICITANPTHVEPTLFYNPTMLQ